jgi:hypothetical protein
MKPAPAIPASILIFIVAVASSFAQPCTLPSKKTWVAVSNANGYRDTLWFGFDSTATCGEDPGLCEISPAEPCGAPSTIFCVWWSSPCGPGGPGDPLWRYDFRRYVNPARVDTHRIRFQPGDSGYPLKFRWNKQEIAALSDSSVLTYFSGATNRQRMDLSDSLTITDELIFEIRLFRYGQRLSSTDAHDSNLSFPRTFVLSQNYPNPFNPSTRIGFGVPVAGYVSLTVFDVLGREVATLAEGKKERGEHSVEWNAEGLPSGVFICRLTTASTTVSRKMLLLR